MDVSSADPAASLGGLRPADPASLLAGDVGVWLLRLEPGALGAQRRSSLAGLVDPGTLRRVSALRRAEDRDRSLVAHAALRHLLGPVLGVEPQETGLSRRCTVCASPAHGKPRLSGPGDVPPWRLSLAHSGSWVAVALSGPAWDVGVDVELVRPDAAWDGVGATVFTDEERRATALGGVPHSFALTQLWARKEAALKVTGVGLAADLRQLTTAGPPCSTPPDVDGGGVGAGWRGRAPVRRGDGSPAATVSVLGRDLWVPAGSWAPGAAAVAVGPALDAAAPRGAQPQELLPGTELTVDLAVHELR